MDKSRKNKRWAFTFAELMISLVVISVLSAILYPTIAQFTPNSNKPLFKSAYKTLNEALTEIVNEQPNGELPEKGATWLCQEFCKKVNVLPSVKSTAPTVTYAANCADDCANEFNGNAINMITTSNGMRWKFTGYEQHTNPAPQDNTDTRANLPEKTYMIFVDVNASNNNLSHSASNPGSDGRMILTGSGNINADKLFKSNCIPNDAKGNCGVFYYDLGCGLNTGIYDKPRNLDGSRNEAGACKFPNYTPGNNIKPTFYSANLRNQDTFEIHIDKTGKIVAMSPAAWANLEDNVDTGN